MVTLERQSESARGRDIEARLARALKPVAPAPAFRARLREGLRLAARPQQTTPALAYAKRNEGPWGWLVGAAALGSAAGLIAVMLRARQTHRSSQPAALQETAH